jgi:hypothetical protein
MVDALQALAIYKETGAPPSLTSSTAYQAMSKAAASGDKNAILSKHKVDKNIGRAADYLELMRRLVIRDDGKTSTGNVAGSYDPQSGLFNWNK